MSSVSSGNILFSNIYTLSTIVVTKYLSNITHTSRVLRAFSENFGRKRDRELCVKFQVENKMVKNIELIGEGKKNVFFLRHIVLQGTSIIYTHVFILYYRLYKIPIFITPSSRCFLAILPNCFSCVRKYHSFIVYPKKMFTD